MQSKRAKPNPKQAQKPSDLKSPELYLHRELSMLAFNRRVLEQAQDAHTPLLERLRFLSISTSNMDEFFEVKVAALKQQIALGLPSPGTGTSPRLLLAEIAKQTHYLVAQQYSLYNQGLRPALKKAGIQILEPKAWGSRRDWIRRKFASDIQPVLTPLGLDPAQPFPQVANKSLNFILALEGEDAFGRNSRFAIVQVPRALPRVILIPPPRAATATTRRQAQPKRNFVLLSTMIAEFASRLFDGMKVCGCYAFRITRNSNLWVDEEDAVDLLDAIAGELPHRHYGAAVRLEVGMDTPEDITDFLLEHFGLTPADLYRAEGPVNMARLSGICDLARRPDLLYPPFSPRMPPALSANSDIFAAIKKSDILLHHPYERFDPVLQLLESAAQDPSVLAIKITLYRTGKNSPVVDALIKASHAGKEVAVIIELRARFDEAANVNLATELQQAGAIVGYGVLGYKTHAKMLLVVRKEGRSLKRYIHLGTGNYHAQTAAQYTDIGLLSVDPVLSNDVHKLFRHLTGRGKVATLSKIIQAPMNLMQMLERMILAETRAAKAGKKAKIMIKINGLADRPLIQRLYEASQAGVEILLIVRGICALRPGIPDISNNIRVISIVGRFLEHSRVFYFYASGQEKLYCSSADWLPRNLYRRVETAFPIENPSLKKRLIYECLTLPLRDTQQAWQLKSDGSYARLADTKRKTARSKQLISSQEILAQKFSEHA